MECFKGPNCKQMDIWIPLYDFFLYNGGLMQAGVQPQSAIVISIKRNSGVTKGKQCKSLLWNPAGLIFKAVWATTFIRSQRKKKAKEMRAAGSVSEPGLFQQDLATSGFHKSAHSPTLCGGLVPERLGLWLTEVKAEDLCSGTILWEQSFSHVHVYGWTCEKV